MPLARCRETNKFHKDGFMKCAPLHSDCYWNPPRYFQRAPRGAFTKVHGDFSPENHSDWTGFSFDPYFFDPLVPKLILFSYRKLRQNDFEKITLFITPTQAVSPYSSLISKERWGNYFPRTKT